MFGFPPLPPLEGLHPIIVHLPIGILAIAWVPMVLGLLFRKHRSGLFFSALVILALGTIFLFAAVFTGEAAEEYVEHSVQYSSAAIDSALHEHEELGESIRIIFVGIFALYFISQILHHKLPESKKKPIGIASVLVVTLAYFFGLTTLANVGHTGGLLVHDLGIHAPIGAVDPETLPAHSDNHDDED